MSRPRAAQLTATTTAVLLIALLATVSVLSHEQDEPLGTASAGGSAGPGRSQSVAMPTGLVTLELRLGQNQAAGSVKESEGEVSVSEGKVLTLDVVRGQVVGQVRPGRFRVGPAPAPAKAKAKANANAKKKQNVNKKQQTAKQKAKAATAASQVILVGLDAPESATVTLSIGADRVSFAISDLKIGQVKPLLEGEAAVVRQSPAARLTGKGTEDDFPALATAPDGQIWLVSTEYYPEQARLNTPPEAKDFDALVPKSHGDLIRLRQFDGNVWRPGIDVTDGRRDIWRPTIALDGKGTVHVAWAEQRDGDWEIYRRAYTPATNGEGQWSEIQRVSTARGSDFHVVATTDSEGRVWLAWQAFRDGNYEILATSLAEGHPWSTPKVVSNSPANDWSPAIASDRSGGVFVAWDSYDAGNYDVLIRDIGRDKPAVAVASSHRFEARPNLASDREGRIWIAYEEGDEQWGKDFASVDGFQKVGLARNPGFALYVNRTVKLKCLADGKLSQLETGAEPAFGSIGDRNKSLPRLLVGDNSLWLLVRHHPLPGGQGEVWVSSALRFDGKSWSEPIGLPYSTNILDNRPALASTPAGGVVVYSTDSRQNTATRGESDLYATRLTGSAAEADGAWKLVETTSGAEGPSTLALVHPNEKADIERVRGHVVDLGGKTLKPLRGEFHRHTEYTSHRDQDGLLEDSWRYARDAADLDWMGNGDHLNGSGHEYLWWVIQKMTDLHHNAPRFVAAQTYERSVVYPNGHRNVMMPGRGIRPLPFTGQIGTEEGGSPDTKYLYSYLKHFGGICASHTSGTNMGTDWRDNDPSVEPIVEIYQGHRHNYEHFGAPRSPTEATQIGGYQPKGFIWNALEKGYRLGFQSSSDHVSTHWSYAIVFVEDTSRQAIIDAFKKRHCYAATDNILLDVRSGAHFMGDSFNAAGKPALDIIVKGTAPVAKVHVIRDNRYVFTTEPSGKDVTLRYTDDAPEAGTHFYYVRVEQADGNLAWGSPMWITLGQ